MRLSKKGRVATKPSRKNSIGSMTLEKSTIAKGSRKINARVKKAPATKKYTVGQLGRKPYGFTRTRP